MKRIFLTGAILLGSLASFSSVAQQDMTPEQQAAAATETRQAVFKLLAFSNAPLGQMARGGEWDREAAIQGTERLIVLADMIPEVFAAMDTTAHDVDTQALDSIWGSMDEFEGLANDLRSGAEAALAILEEQGEDGVRNAIREIGPKCGACHDRFRLD